MTDLVAKLQNSLQRKSLSETVRDRQQQQRRAEQANHSFLLLDCSGSMADYVEPGRAKIDALREIVTALRQRVGFTQIIFPDPWNGRGEHVADYIPEPRGSTPLHEALASARQKGAKHCVLISDGLPDDTSAALAEARQMQSRGVQIDVFYVGPRPHAGEEFLRLLAQETGGQFQSMSLEYKKMAGLIDGAAKALALPAPGGAR